MPAGVRAARWKDEFAISTAARYMLHWFLLKIFFNLCRSICLIRHKTELIYISRELFGAGCAVLQQFLLISSQFCCRHLGELVYLINWSRPSYYAPLKVCCVYTIDVSAFENTPYSLLAYLLLIHRCRFKNVIRYRSFAQRVKRSPLLSTLPATIKISP